MMVKAIQCPRCEYIIYSRARHDYRKCHCGAISVDGGFDYLRICYDSQLISSIKSLRSIEIEVKSKKELYDDWNLQQNKYGLISPNDVSFKQ